MRNKIPEYGLILADDVLNPKKALTIAKEVAPYMDAIKLGVCNISKDLSLLSRTKKVTGKPIIADFKVADVGIWNQRSNAWEGTNEKIVSMLINAGADYVTCHGFPGISSMQECIEVAHELGGKVLVVAYMTGYGAELFFDQPIDVGYTSEMLKKLGIKIDVEKSRTILDLILRLGEHLNADGFIGPANKPTVLRRYREFTQKPIYGPGIGRQAIGNITPKDQLKQFYQICGRASAAIIGSEIYGDPKNPNTQNAVRSAEKFRSWRNELLELYKCL